MKEREIVKYEWVPGDPGDPADNRANRWFWREPWWSVTHAPGVVKKKKGDWRVVPPRDWNSEGEEDVENLSRFMGAEIYPTRKAAMVACRLMYEG